MRSKHLVYIILLISCCFPASDVFCQPIENHFTHYSVNDGLADGSIRSITQDSAGFLWVACDNGLSRFDGHTFKTYRYDPLDTNSLRENRIWHLYIDSEKRLWIVSFHWLYLYHPEGDWFEHFNVRKLINDNITHISTDHNDQLIIGGDKAIYNFDTRKKIFSVHYHDGENPKSFGFYLKDDDGIEWMSSVYGLLSYDPKTKKTIVVDSLIWKNKKGGNTIINIEKLPGDYLLVGTYDAGLYLVNRKTNAIKRFFPDKKDPIAVTRSFYKLNDSIFLLGTQNGLYVFNLLTETFTSIKNSPSNPASLLESDQTIFCIFRDREGIIWLGGGNLEKYDYEDYNVKISPYNAHEIHMRVFDDCFSLYKSNDGKFLLGGYHGMHIYDPSTSKMVNVDRKILNGNVKITFNPTYQFINNFQQDTQGNIWCVFHVSVVNMGTELCFFSLKNDRLQNAKRYELPYVTGITDMKLNQKGNVLIGTSDRGLEIFDVATKTFTCFDTNSKAPSQLTSSLTTSVCEDHNGCVWVGTKKGLNKLEKDGKTIKQYGLNNKNPAYLADWYIHDIKEDKHGIIWFTTREHGIGRINPQNDSVSFFSIKEGLPTSMLQEICIDNDDNLWARTKMGMVTLNVVTLQNKLYTEDEGFPAADDILNIHCSKYTNKLYILTPYSIYEIDAKNTTHKSNLLQTAITGFSVFENEKPISPGKDIFLNYNENFINIQFAYLLFHSNKQIKYAYKMEGINNDWVYCNYKRNAPYTNLPPGNYVFNVKAQSPDGVWNSPTLLTIVIKPPFWETWWFYLAEIIAAVTFIAGLFRFYLSRELVKRNSEIEKLLAVSNERARIASDIHDELGAGLTSIRMLSESAGGKMKQDIAPISEIEKIEKYSSSLSDNLREIIWTMNTRFDKLNDFIIYIRSYAVEYFEDSTIKFQFTKPAIIPELVMSGELRRNLFLCIKEALNNIVKHSHATNASVTFSIVDNILTIEIKDNGIGIDPEQTNKFGNGLNTMKARLNKFGSELEIDVNNGTKLIFNINIFYNK